MVVDDDAEQPGGVPLRADHTGDTLGRPESGGAGRGAPRRDAGCAQLLAQPDPLALLPIAPYHADSNEDWTINLFELTRVIELYNTRAGTTRTGAYHVQSSPTTEDGFAPGP